MNPDIIGCVWTREFDLNTLRVDGEILESGKKMLRIKKYPDTCGRGLKRRHFKELQVKENLFDCPKIWTVPSLRYKK